MNPKASVIIPAYNAEAFVAQAIESVLRQSYGDFELLVMDDGSTDATANVIEAYRDARVRLVRHANQGLSRTLNRGIDLSRGEIITYLDADDVWMPTKLEREMAIFDSEEDVGLVFCDFERFNEHGILTHSQFAFYRGLEGIATRAASAHRGRIALGDAFTAFISMGEFPAYHSAIAVRRAVLGRTRFMDVKKDSRGVLTFLEDLAFFPRIFARTRVAYLAEPLMRMRRHESNSTVFYNSLDVAKLNSLLAVREEELDAHQAAALSKRIANAEVLAGRQRMRERQVGEALRHNARAASLGKLHSVLLSLLRAPYDLWRGEMAMPGTPGGTQPGAA